MVTASRRCHQEEFVDLLLFLPLPVGFRCRSVNAFAAGAQTNRFFSTQPSSIAKLLQDSNDILQTLANFAAAMRPSCSRAVEIVTNATLVWSCFANQPSNLLYMTSSHRLVRRFRLDFLRRSPEELFNTFTHLAGVLFTLSAAWFILKLGYDSDWQNALGVTFFTCGMLVMYAALVRGCCTLQEPSCSSTTPAASSTAFGTSSSSSAVSPTGSPSSGFWRHEEQRKPSSASL